jgi:hypothetical protein
MTIVGPIMKTQYQTTFPADRHHKDHSAIFRQGEREVNSCHIQPQKNHGEKWDSDKNRNKTQQSYPAGESRYNCLLGNYTIYDADYKIYA